MINTSKEEIDSIIKNLKIFFSSCRTRDINFRIENLKRFYKAILKYEDKIAEALWKDLHKSHEETFLTETSIVLQEIKNHIRHLKSWAKPKRVPTPVHLFPSSGKILYEPLGVALIVAPWNYPFQLLMNPLVGAISSGCCAMLKPSPYTPETANVMKNIIHETFDQNYINIVQGDREVNQILFEARFDIIFFTGSPALGKVVMEAASKYLTPVVLELGGKSPCIVDKDANIKIAAKRIAFGKLINAGQTCIAPDYLYIHESIKDKFVENFKEQVNIMYGNNCKQSKYYPRIVNQKAIERLKKLMQNGKIIFGGEVDEDERYISPTLIDNVKPEYPIMQEEIFGPILPVMTFKSIEETINYITSHEKPLAFYYFGKNKKAKEILNITTSGGGCVNDTLMHIVNHHLPFGGVGNSGMGKYHGKESFLAFSNKRSIVKTPTWIDLPVKYAPFKYFNIVKKILK
ncbi:MAG: aldehyde dehydrogenase [Bacteroidales bacterium]|jgi:aldehyde dehydrogenase (NAD+)|nr:aldehyde dehydrogenase [Bacteroidales bacterium]